MFTDHNRRFEQNRFVYPVVSRRSKGISIGVNLNPDKVCNFDCIYCQVDRRSESDQRFVEQEALLAELTGVLELCVSGTLFESPRFKDVPEHLRRLNDIAFSGDGEPTTYRNFDELMELCATTKSAVLEARPAAVADNIKMVLITNASMFHRPHVQRGLAILDANQGEIWAKLDAGTDEYYQLIERTKVPFERVLDNIRDAARVRPLVIQSLFMRVNGQPPSRDEISAYVQRLQAVGDAGGEIRLVQVYTVARTPAESYVGSLDDDEVDAITHRVRSETGLAAESYYGNVSDSDSHSD